MTWNDGRYQVHLTLVALRKREATIRAFKRFSSTNRYVPLGYVFDEVGNDPMLSYYLLKDKASGLFNSFGAISTDVDHHESPRCIDLKGDNPAAGYEKSNNHF